MDEKKLLWLSRSGIQTPPFSDGDRKTAGWLLRLLQQGVNVGPPHSKPTNVIGPRSHEFVVNVWRILYRIDPDVVLVVHIFRKKSQKTPEKEIKTAQLRLAQYDSVNDEGEEA